MSRRESSAALPEKAAVAPLRPANSPQGGPRLSRGGPVGQLLGVQIAAMGSYLPPLVVKNEDLAALGYDSDWIVQRTGIRERRHAPSELAASDLAYEAARACLDQAGVKPQELDLIIVGTFTPDSQAPTTACRLQHRLGATAPAMDLNAACSGFMYALITAMQYVKCGTSRRALVVGVDICSRICNPSDAKIFPIFGDGAGAALVTPGDQGQGLLAFELGADGSGGDLLVIPGGGSREPLSAAGLESGRQFLAMDGRSVFKWAVRLATESIREVLAHTHLTLQDIDGLVLHQANQRILDAVAEELGIRREQLLVNLEQVGNTSAASIPLVLDAALRAGRIVRGSRVLMCGFGAGLTWGTGLAVW